MTAYASGKDFSFPSGCQKSIFDNLRMKTAKADFQISSHALRR